MSVIQPLERFDVENEREERLRVERELQRRHEKGQDLELGFGEAPFGLIFSDANGVRVSIALDGSSNLTATNVDTGLAVTLVAYDDIGGAPTSLAELDDVAAADLVTLSSGLATTTAAVTANASTISTNTTSIADLTTTINAQFGLSAGGILSNFDYSEIDGDGKPEGIQPVERSYVRDEISVDAYGLVVSNPATGTIGVGFPAVAVIDSIDYEVTITWKASVASSSGVFFRINELSSALASGETHIGVSASSPARQRTSLVDLYSNGAAFTTEQVSVFTYTPTAGTELASFCTYNWTGLVGDLHVASIVVQPSGGNALEILTAEIESEAVARASGDAANATSISTLSAVVNTGVQRPNLIPPELRLLTSDDPPDLTLTNCVFSPDTNTHPFDPNASSYRISVSGAFTSASNAVLVRMNPNDLTQRVRLIPGRRYGMKVAGEFGAEVTDILFRLRRPNGGFLAQVTIPNSSPGVQTVEGVFPVIDAAWAESEFTLGIEFLTSAAVQIRIDRWHLEQMPDDVTQVGDWADDGLAAGVQTLADAFVDRTTGLAVAAFEVIAAASGSTPARFGLRSGDGTSAIVLDADNLYLGDNTVFEDTYNSFVTEESGDRNRFGGPFPASGDLLEWFGPTSVALNSETRTNGYFAKGTDGKVYYGSAELNAGGTFTAAGNPTSITNTANNSSYSNGITCVATGGSGGNTYNWYFLSETGANWSFSNSSISNPNVIANSITQRPSIARLGCLVVDSQGNTAQMKPVTVQYGSFGG